MKWHEVLVVFIFLAYGNFSFGAETSFIKDHPKPTSLQMDALGATVPLMKPLGINDVIFLEPVCALIFKYSNRFVKDNSLQQWYIQLQDSPLLDLPEYNIAKGAISLHHYCYSKVVEHYYYKEKDPIKRTFWAGYVASGYKFVIDHQEYRPTNWHYLAKLYVDYGNALMLGGKLTQSALAINAFETALRNDNAFVPAMVSLAEVYEKLGKKSKALEYVTEGLRYKPNSKSLKLRYEELGGKPPYPEPYPAPELTSHTEELKPSETTPPERKEGEATTTQVTPNVKEAGQGTDPKQNMPPAADSMGKNQDKPATGTGSQPSNNPFCRFCP